MNTDAADRDFLSYFGATTEAETHVMDAADPVSIEACISRAREAFGRLDGIVNCMGGSIVFVSSAVYWPGSLGKRGIR